MLVKIQFVINPENKHLQANDYQGNKIYLDNDILTYQFLDKISGETVNTRKEYDNSSNKWINAYIRFGDWLGYQASYELKK